MILISFTRKSKVIFLIFMLSADFSNNMNKIIFTIEISNQDLNQDKYTTASLWYFFAICI